MIEVADFKDWASQCAERGWKGPFKLVSRPYGSYQFITDEHGTEAMWNGEANIGFIFGSNFASEGDGA